MAFAGMTPALTIAVCKAGGIGALGVGFTPPELLREYIRTIRAATDAPFNVNIITCFDNDAQVKRFVSAVTTHGAGCGRLAPLTLSAQTASARRVAVRLKCHHKRVAMSSSAHLSKKVDVLTLAKISRHKDLSLLSNVYYRATADEIARKI